MVNSATGLLVAEGEDLTLGPKTGLSHSQLCAQNLI